MLFAICLWSIAMPRTKSTNFSEDSESFQNESEKSEKSKKKEKSKINRNNFSEDSESFRDKSEKLQKSKQKSERSTYNKLNFKLKQDSNDYEVESYGEWEKLTYNPPDPVIYLGSNNNNIISGVPNLFPSNRKSNLLLPPSTPMPPPNDATNVGFAIAAAAVEGVMAIAKYWFTSQKNEPGLSESEFNAIMQEIKEFNKKVEKFANNVTSVTDETIDLLIEERGKLTQKVIELKNPSADKDMAIISESLKDQESMKAIYRERSWRSENKTRETSQKSSAKKYMK